MKYIFLISLFSIVVIVSFYAKAVGQDPNVLAPTNGFWAYTMLNIVKQNVKPSKIIKVAIVDDGFRISHQSIKDFIFKNPAETLGNYQDDDQDGFTDDIHGWDISDNDNDVNPPRGNEDIYYHGTYLAGIITTVFKLAYGDDAYKYLKIIPVKVLSDNSRNTYLADGYKGVKYAFEMGADIICCAWSGGSMSEDDKALFSKAIKNGTIIIGSAGNLFSENEQLPSAFPGVFSIAAVDSAFHKMKLSNYGMRVDISAPGVMIYGPHPIADNAYIYESGTSPAAAIITGCAAILKALVPEALSAEILNAIKNTAIPVDSVNLSFCGKLGSGVPNMAKAIEFLSNPKYRYTFFDPYRPEGKIFYIKNKSPLSYEIHPAGAYKGIHFYSASDEYKGKVKLLNCDSVYYSGFISNLSKGLFMPGSNFKIEFQAKSQSLSRNMEFNYYMETIDSTTLFCKDIIFEDNETGIITDNSGNQHYANNSSCKWQINVPIGKKIKIEFDEMDTQSNVDYVWIFDGNSTLLENLLAKFSGNHLPPKITSLSNEVLIWFLTDSNTTGKGWELEYQAVEEK